MLAEWEWVLVGERRLHENMLRGRFYASLYQSLFGKGLVPSDHYAFNDALMRLGDHVI